MRARLFLTLLFLSCNAQAVVTYQTVAVGNPGNLSDPLTGFGGVSYPYRIGKFQVTIAQYTEFLNAVAANDANGLYTPSMTSPNIAGIQRAGSPGSYTYSVMNNSGPSGNRPITFVNWFNAARFANWLANGQPSGPQDPSTTEDGAYPVNGATDGFTVPKNTINPNTGSPPDFYLPSDDEWYKAAFYDGVGAYYQFATQSNNVPGNAIGAQPNQANYISNSTGYCTTQSFETSITVNYLTDVGAFTSSGSFYDTYDQTGNVWEWNANNDTGQRYAKIRGGAFTSTVPPYLLNSYYLATLPNQVAINVGFRLAAP